MSPPRSSRGLVAFEFLLETARNGARDARAGAIAALAATNLATAAETLATLYYAPGAPDDPVLRTR